MPRRKHPADEEIIVIDRRDPPFFVMDKKVIDQHWNVYEVAICAFILRHGHGNSDEIMSRFNLPEDRVKLSMYRLLEAGFITRSEVEE